MSTKHRHKSIDNNSSRDTTASHETDRDTLIEGLIMDGSRGQYRVETPQGAFLCTIRGRLRKQLTYSESTSAHRRVRDVKVIEKDPVTVGDRVHILPTSTSTGVIEAVIARTGGSFTRDDPKRGGGNLTTVTGLDQMAIVFAARNPEPHLRLLDRLLVLAEAQELAALICLNKADLGLSAELAGQLESYRRIGYRVVLASAAEGRGIEELRGYLDGQVSAFIGPSGVGKSSLLNAIQPELGQRVSSVSAATHKGRHTTTGTRLFALDGSRGGYIADTAGIRALGFFDGAIDRLDACFREFRAYLGSCRLADCRHLSEPGCAIREATRRREIEPERYESYCRMASGTQSALGSPSSEFDV